MWEKELREALGYAGDHLSLYQLTIEPQTQFHTRARRGEQLTAPDDSAVTMYEMTQEMMAKAGLPAYEISNHARKGQESRHNLTYWRYEDYIGIGPGAHGRIGIQGAGGASEKIYPQPQPQQKAAKGMKQQVMSVLLDLRNAKSRFLKPRPFSLCYATENHRAPDTWLQQVDTEGHGLKAREPIDAELAMREALMMGLRLTEGINMEKWRQKFTAPLPRFLHSKRLARLKREGYIVQEGKTLRATPAGLQRLNAILGYLG
jgi:oxygen-independent coproporphyrinogen-3 oxidase